MMMISTAKNLLKARTVSRSLVVMSLMLGAAGCTTLPNPTDAGSSLIIVSIEAQRAIASVRPSVATIVRKEDGKEIPYTDKSGKYYYFANLPAGTYQIKTAALPIKAGGFSSTTGNVTVTNSYTNENNFPFGKEIVEASTVNLTSGKVMFMGSITGEGSTKLFPPGAVEISNVKISTNSEERQAALDAFRQDYKDSAWLSRF